MENELPTNEKYDVHLINLEFQDRKQHENLISKMMLLRAYPILKKAQLDILESEMIDDLNDEEKTLILFYRFLEQIESKEKYPFSLNLMQELLKFFLKPLIRVILIQVLLTLGQLILPVLIKLSIDCVVDAEHKLENGIILIVLILLIRLSNILSQSHQRMLRKRKLGYESMSVISMLIMKKSLRISLLSNNDRSIGEITNLMQVDSQKLILASNDLLNLAMIPLYLIISLILMYHLIGISFTIGFIIILLTIILNIKNGENVIKSQVKLLEAKDNRIKQINEIFTQIKFIKINALEEYFLQKVYNLRQIEIKCLKDRLFYSAIIIFSGWLAPQIILSSTFGLYIYLGNTMNPSIIFSIISLFQILQITIQQLPISITALLETKLCLNRIQQFLTSQEIMTDYINQKEFRDNEIAISVNQGNFYWNRSQVEKQELILKNIEMLIAPGQLVSIIGDVGSGKTSFVQSLLGEMLYKDGPKVQIYGQIAYVSQKAWIQNATVRDNILFGKPYHQQSYEKAIHYSCLKQDMEILINSDQTVIGEKGINLSGGQKARISLARAIYSDASIYLLDDPLSAVDSHVGNFLMKECILNHLKNTTRILITHSLNYCKYADYIYLFDNGQIFEKGIYSDLKLSKRFQNIAEKCNMVEEVNENNVQIQKTQEDTQLTTTKEHKINANDNIIIAEERHKGEISFSVFNQYFEYGGGYCNFILVLIIMIFWILTYLGSSLWLSEWTLSTYELSNYSYLIIYFIFGCLQALLAFIRALTIIRQSIKSSSKIHDEMMDCLMYAPQCQFFERVPLGRIMNRLTKDINQLDTEIYMNISWLYTKVSQLASHIFLNIYASTYLMLFPIFIFFGVCMKIQRGYTRASRELQRLELMSKSPILSYFSETLTGLTTIRSYQQVNQFIKTFGQKLDENRKIVEAQVITNAWFTQILGLTSLIVNMSAIIYCILYTNNPALAGLVMTYASNIDMNIQQTIESISSLENDMISFERCQAFTTIEKENRNEKKITLNNWPSSGSVEFKSLSVQYRQNLPYALNKISFKINPMDKIGIVGRTGAGKSTITMSILRLLDRTEGQILIDDIDTQNISLKQLRESITSIIQDAVIFNGTIRDNLDPLNKCSDDEIKQVLLDCCLDKLTENRNGLYSNLYEDGDNLSAGEKQLLCIARAILKKSKIILIDEATANIDVDTEHKIQDTISKAFKNCTVITIAHRINTILNCDKIIVINKGQVQEYGLTKELLNNEQSTFYQIYSESQLNNTKK
ncbi:unnamed protein product [Paramecium pentaurelia]|uniref:Uncharacterized protein n=1 Tax=Paramecium pentaurelia TaxID=43138 RepID=A0A8S1TXW0_9CILI|nr:unnamed protein product [Paramecium pentaurelia]